jgi:hypothetical protein
VWISLMLVTALSSFIGYDKASKIAHCAMDNDRTPKAAMLKVGYGPNFVEEPPVLAPALGICGGRQRGRFLALRLIWRRWAPGAE